MLDREMVNALLTKRFPSASPRDLAAAINAIVGLDAANRRKENPMITLKNIVVATDFGDAAASALAYGRELARRFDATLHLVHIVDDVGARFSVASGLPYDATSMQKELEASEHRRLDALVTEQDRRELKLEVVQIPSPSPAREITDYALAARADLIIVGTHGRGPVAHLLMGSVAERIVRTAPCPVLTVRHPEHEFIQPDALEAVARK